MKIRYYRIVLAFLFFYSAGAFAAKPLTYFIPEHNYNEKIPTPESFFGFQVGEWHLHHALLHSYFQLLSSVSDRAVLYEYGRSHEQKPLVHMIITSPQNQKRLEQIRLQHLVLVDPARSSEADISTMPVIVRLGYGVHGNEPSAHNAAPLVAYYLLASKSPEVAQMLEQMIIIIDPSMNPDGQDRFASWVNRHRSRILNPDPAGREFYDVWPGSRSNHYWFDLNRDWLPATQPETRGRLAEYNRWMPNVNTDHHEFGANSTFYFQPGVPSRGNIHTPRRTNDLTKKMAQYHAKAFDATGQLYYTEEDFDDFYYGKGSSYPDVRGGIGILFEQAGTKGHRVETIHGVVDFSETVRNQVLVSFSTLQAAFDLRLELLEHLRWFFRSSIQEARDLPVRAYLVGHPSDKNLNHHFIDLMLAHNIDVFEIKESWRVGNTHFKPGFGWLVPLDQPQSRLVRSAFEKITQFEDSLFYDVSAWTLPLAFNIPYVEITNARQMASLRGNPVTIYAPPIGKITGQKTNYAYLFKWDDYYAAKALYYIQAQGLRTRVATQPLSININNREVEFGYGSILVPVAIQDFEADKVFDIVKKAAEIAGIEVFSVSTSLSSKGVNLGSSAFVSLKKPVVLMLIGQGINSREAGEIWHLLDQRFDMPVSMVETSRLNNLDLTRYNTLVLVSGSYSEINQAGREAIERWLRNGGNIIAIGNANNWLQGNGFADIEFVKIPEIKADIRMPYSERSNLLGARRNPGSIFKAKIDITHPIGYGLINKEIPVFVSGNTFAKPNKNPFANPLHFPPDNLLSGYVFEPFRPMIENSAGISVYSMGRGNIISFFDNPNFRGFWFGTNRLFLNALFFGPTVRL